VSFKDKPIGYHLSKFKHARRRTFWVPQTNVYEFVLPHFFIFYFFFYIYIMLLMCYILLLLSSLCFYYYVVTWMILQVLQDTHQRTSINIVCRYN